MDAKLRRHQQEMAQREEKMKQAKVQKELEQQLKRQKQRQRDLERQQREDMEKNEVTVPSVNPDNFAKIQNIIDVIVKNKMSFCSTKIHSSEHAIHHVTNCAKCMNTLEQFKG